MNAVNALHACSAGSAARVCVRQPQLRMRTDQETDKRKSLGALVALAEVQSQQQYRLLFTVPRICVLVALSSQRLCCVCNILPLSSAVWTRDVVLDFGNDDKVGSVLRTKHNNFDNTDRTIQVRRLLLL